MLDAFPTLVEAELHAAIAAYLANKEELDAYLAQREMEAEAMRLAHADETESWQKTIERAKQIDSGDCFPYRRRLRSQDCQRG